MRRNVNNRSQQQHLFQQVICNHCQLIQLVISMLKSVLSVRCFCILYKTYNCTFNLPVSTVKLIGLHFNNIPISRDLLCKLNY